MVCVYQKRRNSKVLQIREIAFETPIECGVKHALGGTAELFRRLLNFPIVLITMFKLSLKSTDWMYLPFDSISVDLGERDN